MLSKNTNISLGRRLARTDEAVNRLFQHWTSMLGLRWWEEVKILTYNTRNDMPESQRVSGATAYADVSWEYKTAVCGFCLELMIGMPPAEIERVVVHELCHLLINAMRDYEKMGIKIEELVVTNLTQAFIWVATEGRGELPRKKNGSYRKESATEMSDAEYMKELNRLLCESKRK